MKPIIKYEKLEKIRSSIFMGKILPTDITCTRDGET